MARKRRYDEPGAWHHVMSRGARREVIFLAEAQCFQFLDTVGEACARFSVEVHAYVLMPNHYHLLMRSPCGTLSRAMRHINGVYTLRFNRARGLDGPLFRGRFRSQRVRKEAHLDNLVPYIHTNPVRAQLAGSLDESDWSSHHAYAGLGPCPDWLTTGFFLDLFGGVESYRRRMAGYVKKTAPWPTGLDLESGWITDPDAAPSPSRLREDELPELAPPTSIWSGSEVLQEVCAITGADRDRLLVIERGPGANPERRFAAWALARYTNLSQGQIALSLSMTRHQVPRLLARLRRHLPPPLDAWDAQLGARREDVSSGDT